MEPRSRKWKIARSHMVFNTSVLCEYSHFIPRRDNRASKSAVILLEIPAQSIRWKVNKNLPNRLSHEPFCVTWKSNDRTIIFRVAAMNRVPLDAFGYESSKNLEMVLQKTGTTRDMSYFF